VMRFSEIPWVACIIEPAERYTAWGVHGVYLFLRGIVRGSVSRWETFLGQPIIRRERYSRDEWVVIQMNTGFDCLDSSTCANVASGISFQCAFDSTSRVSCTWATHHMDLSHVHS
jgi:hypothetical protein